MPRMGTNTTSEERYKPWKTVVKRGPDRGKTRATSDSVCKRRVRVSMDVAQPCAVRTPSSQPCVNNNMVSIQATRVFYTKILAITRPSQCSCSSNGHHKEPSQLYVHHDCTMLLDRQHAHNVGRQARSALLSTRSNIEITVETSNCPQNEAATPTVSRLPKYLAIKSLHLRTQQDPFECQS